MTISVNTAEVSSDGQQHQVSYADANGDGHTANAIALDGTETSLAAGTYFVGLPTVTFNHRLNLSGNVTLILKDGCTMNVGTSDARINDYGIRGTSSEVTIYGQNAGNGTLSVYTGASNYYGVSVDHLTINSGIVKVNATGEYAHAIYNFGNTTINGGTVEATANSIRSYALYCKTVTLNGGTVKANGTDAGIKSHASSGDGIVFAGAYVTASSYSVNGGTVRVASGLQYSDGTNIYTDATASATLAALTNTTLRLILPYLDENGTSQTCKNYYLLDGTETILGTPDKESWYAVQGTINYSECIYLYGNVKIILADGATMTVGTTDSPIENYGLYEHGSLGIYAQSTGSNRGRLSVVVIDHAGIYVQYNFAIAGGQIEAINTGTGTDDSFSGIDANSVSLTNATVTATGVNGIRSGIDVTINGSTVTATGNNEDGIATTTGNISVINNSHVISHGNKRGMFANSSVTVNGSEVEAIKTGPSTNSNYFGISANSVSLTNATVTATGTTGICLGSDLTISGSTVTATGTRYYGINVGVANTSISNSSHVISHGYEMGIYVEGNVTISGSEVEATMTSTNISSPLASAISANSISIRDNSTVTATGGSGICGGVSIGGSTVTATGTRYYGIFARSYQDVTVAGGQVSITGEQQGIYSYYNNISLGWTNTSDYIFASSYSVEGDGTLSVADGQTLIDGNGNTYSGTLTNTQISALAGKTLHPAILLNNDADNSTAIAQASTLCEGGKQIAVQLQDRTFYKDGDWNTLCLPFDVALEGSPLEGAIVMALDGTNSGLSDGTLTLNFVSETTTLHAGTPYIIKWTRADDYADDDEHNIVNPVFTGVTIDNTDRSVISADGKVTFKGSYDYQSFTEEDRSILLLGADNTLYWPQSGARIGACRAYFQLNNGVTAGDPSNPNAIRAFQLNFDCNVTTGVSEMRNEEGEMRNGNEEMRNDGAWYSLDGRKLDKPTVKGLYIHNGRKILIK